MSRREIECLLHMVYHRGYAVRMETYIPDPNVDPHPKVPVFELDRIDDFRDAIDRGYLDVAAAYGDLYRLIPLEIAPNGDAKPKTMPRYNRYRTRMEDANGYVVEMQTELSSPGSPWGAGIRPHDSKRMDAAHKALEANDLETAAQYGKVYRLEPVDVKPVVEPWQPSRKGSGRRATRAAPESTG